MGLDLRLPNITSGTPEGQIQQINSYLYQLVNQLTWAFDHIEVETTAPVSENVSSPTRTFNSIKSLIIRDNDIAVTNLDRAYPVGAIYISASETNPATLFGFGTWEQLKDRFLLSAGDTYEAGATGGEAEHTLTVNEMPSHTHLPTTATPGTSAYNKYAFTLNRDWGSDSIARYNISSGTGLIAMAAKTTASDYGGNDDIYQSFETAATGGSQAHNNMPPYLTVYVWKRIA